MKILYIARNIPVPNIKENDIVLRIAKSIEKNSSISIDILFPKEILPKIPFLKNKRIKAISELSNIFISLEKEIKVCKYIRLPTLKYSYILMKSFQWLNEIDSKKMQEYNVIHAHNIMPDGYIGLKLKEKYHIPLVLTVRNGDIDKLAKLKKSTKLYQYYIHILNHSDMILVHNYATKVFIENLGFQTIAISHGIEEKFLLTQNIKKENIVLFVGNMLPRKNLIWLVDAFIDINNTKWKLIILGDGEEYSHIYKKVRNSSNIKMKGRVPREEVLRYMRKSKIFVLPSERETFGIVYVEAAASKCVVIGQRYTGIYGWLKDQEEAIFISTSEELKTSLHKLFKDEVKIKTLAFNGYEKVKNKLLWDRQIQKYIELYRSFI